MTNVAAFASRRYTTAAVGPGGGEPIMAAGAAANELGLPFGSPREMILVSVAAAAANELRLPFGSRREMILVSVAAAAANELRLPFGSRREDPERA